MLLMFPRYPSTIIRYPLPVPGSRGTFTPTAARLIGVALDGGQDRVSLHFVFRTNPGAAVLDFFALGISTHAIGPGPRTVGTERLRIAFPSLFVVVFGLGALGVSLRSVHRVHPLAEAIQTFENAIDLFPCAGLFLGGTGRGFGLRAGPEKAESGGDSQAARVMIHPAGWEEASLDGKTLFAGFAGTHDVGCSFRTVSTRGGADVRCRRELCDQAHAAG